MSVWWVVAWILALLVIGLETGECDGKLVPSVSKGKSVKIAAIGPWELDPTANFTAQLYFLNFTAFYINNQSAILPDVSIELIKADTGTVPGTAIMVAVNMINKGIIAFLGGARTPQQQVVSYLSNAFELPHVGGIVTGAILSDKIAYPYFLRTSVADQYVCMVMMQYIVRVGWKNIVLVHQDDAYGTGNREAFLQLSYQYNITVYTTQVTTGEVDFTSPVSLVQQSGIRIIVILCQINEANNFLRAISNDGKMVNSDYVYLLGQVYFNGFYATTLAATVFDGMIAFSSAAETTPLTNSLWEAWLTTNETDYPGSRVSLPRSGWFLSEGLFTIAKGLDEYMRIHAATNLSALNGSEYVRIMKSLEYDGVSGHVKFDKSGDRLAHCNIFNIRSPENCTSSLCSHFNLSMTYSPFNNSFASIIPISFYGGRTDIPPDLKCPCDHGFCTIDGTCVCYKDYGGAKCDAYIGGDFTTMIIAIIIPIIFALGGIISALLYYHRKRAQIVREISEKQRSDIPRSSIKINKRIGRGASGEVFSALFRGTEVAVKKLSAKNVSQSALQQFQLETAIMTGLRHPNIILFMGSCYDKLEEEFLLVMEYMSRGSLYDVLYNRNIPLSHELQLHLAYQIVQGINFLHQSVPPIIHCDIKSHNVLLDEKWNCRICDFGITIFMSANKKTRSGHSEALGTVYWTAPEVLLGGNHTMQSDCYSIGILLWEIFHRELPYHGRDPLAVAMDVVNFGIRPILNASVPQRVVDLISTCWDSDPGKRYSSQDIVYALRDLAMEKPTYNVSADAIHTRAPTGLIALVASDISNQSILWDTVPGSMQQVAQQHNSIMRTLLDTYRGYEVWLKGHSFLFAFANVSDALNWCLAVQVAFIRTTWPSEVTALPCSQMENTLQGELLWNGPRLKMALHRGIPQCELDKYSQKIYYEGPIVKRVLRIIDLALEGCVLITKPAFDSINFAALEFETTAKPCRITGPPGEEDSEGAVLAVPKLLEERLMKGTHAVGASEESLPFYVVDVGDAAVGLELLAKQTKEKWSISFSELTMRELIGTGTGAEVYRAIMSNTEVAVKLLINQNFSEENSLTIRYLASTLYKLQHPNIVKFFGMVLDPPHICLVTEIMTIGPLINYYSTLTNHFPYTEKIRIAKGIASGMQFLCRSDVNLGCNLRLNSSNVLLGKNGLVKLSDFAIGKLYDSNRTLTVVNAVAWTAPETLNGTSTITPAVAVYSFGIILWEMFTRKKPYNNIHPIKLLNMVLTGYRPEVPQECPSAYAEIMQECWAANPTDRPTWDIVLQKLGNL